MSQDQIPPSVTPLFWDVDVDQIDLDRHRFFVFERVMSRGTWEAMVWLRSRYPVSELADFVRREGARRLTPRDLAYWALVSDVELRSLPGGGRPPWAGT